MSNFFSKKAEQEIKLAALEEEDDILMNTLFDKDYIQNHGVESIRDLIKKVQRNSKLSNTEQLLVCIALKSMFVKLSIIEKRRELDEDTDNGN